MIRITVISIDKRTNDYIVSVLCNRGGVITGMSVSVPDVDTNTIFEAVETSLEIQASYLEVISDLNKVLGEKTWQ